MRIDPRYSRPAIWLHWIVAFLMILNVVLGLSADHWPDDWVRPVIDTHKSVGISVLGLAILRLSWRLSHPPPPMPAKYGAFERTAANLAHVLLYVAMFALPLTGWAHDSAWKDWDSHPMYLFGLAPWPRIASIATLDPDLKENLHDALFLAHTYAGYAFYALIALHVLGALKHQLWDKEPELQRMWPRG
jgi:cytochrome b561